MCVGLLCPRCKFSGYKIVDFKVFIDGYIFILIIKAHVTPPPSPLLFPHKTNPCNGKASNVNQDLCLVMVGIMVQLFSSGLYLSTVSRLEIPSKPPHTYKWSPCQLRCKDWCLIPRFQFIFIQFNVILVCFLATYI